MKVEFDMKYRPQIESGEYRLVTRNDVPVRIINWNAADALYPLYGYLEGNRFPDGWAKNGKYCNDDKDRGKDLFVITDKSEIKPGDVIKCTSTGHLWIRRNGDNLSSDGHTACIGGGYTIASDEEKSKFFSELESNGYRWSCSKQDVIKFGYGLTDQEIYNLIRDFDNKQISGSWSLKDVYKQGIIDAMESCKKGGRL